MVLSFLTKRKARWVPRILNTNKVFIENTHEKAERLFTKPDENHTLQQAGRAGRLAPY